MGLDILAAIGSDIALMHLHGVAEKVKFKALQEKAREKIRAIAAARGLTPEQLADRLVPDLGLDGDGSLTLDFGPRAFKVTFDETLKPLIQDVGGKTLPELPKPNRNDDPDRAAEATERWKTLKKDARAVASHQITRLELAMCAERRWTREEFTTFILGHPLVVHLARRLVWGAYEGAKPKHTFRVAEDGTFADPADAAVTLKDDLQVGIVHRLELPEALLGTWGSVFADYEILQPFDKLGREVYAPSAAEKKASRLERMKDVSVKTGKVMGARGPRLAQGRGAGRRLGLLDDEGPARRLRGVDQPGRRPVHGGPGHEPAHAKARRPHAHEGRRRRPLRRAVARRVQRARTGLRGPARVAPTSSLALPAIPRPQPSPLPVPSRSSAGANREIDAHPSSNLRIFPHSHA